jgi:uncharacterized protein involved in exopolysaccharide biosynthesis
MSPTKHSATQPAELEVEQEVDFGRYFRILGRRWWLLLAGLAIGAVLGAALTLGGGNLYRAKATLYLGQPLSAQNSTQIQSLATNPSSVTQLARSNGILRRVSKESGLPLKKLKAGISTATVPGYLTKLGQTPLVTISVRADAPRLQVQNAANDLAERVLAACSAYPRAKIATLNAEIESYKGEITEIDKRLQKLDKMISGSALTPVEQQVFLTAATMSEQRRGTVSDELQQAQLLLTQARTVEQGKVTIHASAAKTTARSRKNGLIVGGALGFLVGALFALTLPERRRRRAS